MLFMLLLKSGCKFHIFNVITESFDFISRLGERCWGFHGG